MSDRLLGWGIGVIVSIILGTLIYRAYFLEQKDIIDPGSLDVADESKPRPSIKTKMISCKRTKAITRLVGYIENTGTVPLASVTLQTIWKDEYNEVMDTGLVYAVGDTVHLYPGERREFEDTTGLRGVAMCNVRALDWWSSEDER